MKENPYKIVCDLCSEFAFGTASQLKKEGWYIDCCNNYCAYCIEVLGVSKNPSKIRRSKACIY
jgi:hypothetical protein